MIRFYPLSIQSRHLYSAGHTTPCSKADRALSQYVWIKLYILLSNRIYQLQRKYYKDVPSFWEMEWERHQLYRYSNIKSSPLFEENQKVWTHALLSTGMDTAEVHITTTFAIRTTRSIIKSSLRDRVRYQSPHNSYPCDTDTPVIPTSLSLVCVHVKMG